MPITRFALQPTANSLQAAYRPILFKVAATATGGTPLPPFVLCDIYLNSIYYKTMIRTAPESKTTLVSTFHFDISDAVQEYLQPDIAPLNNSIVLQAPHMSAKVFCRFRASDKDLDGFTVEEGIKPVQATKFTQAISGDGTESNTFFAINAALQHEDNQDLTQHLNAFKTGTWDAKAFPLTHRGKHYFFCNNSSDHFPFVYAGNCIEADIVLNYRLSGQQNFLTATALDLNNCNGGSFTTEVIGNRVFIHLGAAAQVQTRYRLAGGGAWTDAGTTATKDFFFKVLGAGTYEVQVIWFCSACSSSEPVDGSFTIGATVSGLAWRGINPFCVAVDTSEGNPYLTLELVNSQRENTYYPNNQNPTSQQVVVTADLVVRFYSDAQHLNPLTLNQNGVKIYIKKKQTLSGTDQTTVVQEELLTFTVNVAGNSIVLQNVETERRDIEMYGRGITSSIVTLSAYSLFPTDRLASGNTGQQGFQDLQEYNEQTGLPTGDQKPNVSSDLDYIEPIDNTTACPTGLPVVVVNYGSDLEIAKVEFRVGLRIVTTGVAPFTGQSFVYAPTQTNTGNGGFIYILNISKSRPVMLSVKAKILDANNRSGVVKVRVTLEDNSQQVFDVPNNIETLLPKIFVAIKSVTISNY